MSKLCLLVHGFNVKDGGKGTIGRLLPFFTARGWDTVLFKMGFINLVEIYTENNKYAKRLAESAVNAKRLGQRVVAVGHSNGCAVIHLAVTKYAAPIDSVTYINPALDNTLKPAEQVKKWSVWYSPSDWPVKLARFMPRSIWGQMGATGYVGRFDPRLTQFNKQEMEVSSSAHSDFAKAEKLSYFGSLITEDTINEILPDKPAAVLGAAA